MILTGKYIVNLVVLRAGILPAIFPEHFVYKHIPGRSGQFLHDPRKIIAVGLMQHLHIIFYDLFFSDIIKINVHEKCAYNLDQTDHGDHKDNLVRQPYFYKTGIYISHLTNHLPLSCSTFNTILDGFQNRFNKNQIFPVKQFRFVRVKRDTVREIKTAL